MVSNYFWPQWNPCPIYQKDRIVNEKRMAFLYNTQENPFGAPMLGAGSVFHPRTYHCPDPRVTTSIRASTLLSKPSDQRPSSLDRLIHPSRRRTATSLPRAARVHATRATNHRTRRPEIGKCRVSRSRGIRRREEWPVERRLQRCVASDRAEMGDFRLRQVPLR